MTIKYSNPVVDGTDTCYPDVMIDIETGGKLPGSVIFSIGMVSFDPTTGELGDSVYIVINSHSCVVHGLKYDESTMSWWAKQSEAARQVIVEAGDGTTASTLTEALNEVRRFMKLRTNPIPWGNSARFDLGMIEAAYTTLGEGVPWKFWHERCYRTVKNLWVENSPRLERLGTYHNALDDARSQAVHLMSLLEVLHGGLILHDKMVVAELARHVAIKESHAKASMIHQALSDGE